MALKDFLKRTAQNILMGGGKIDSMVRAAPELWRKKPPVPPTGSALPPPPPVPKATREALPGEQSVAVSDLGALKSRVTGKAGGAAMTAPTPGQKNGTVTKPAPDAPPAGATLISGPSGLAGLKEDQIYRAPGGNIYRLAGAGAGSSTPGGTGTAPTGPTGPAAPAAPVPDPEAQKKALERKLVELTGPGAGTVDEATLAEIQGKIAQIDAQKNLSQVEAGQQTIETGFVTGQQAAIEKRAAALAGVEGAKATTLQNKIALAQQKRVQERDAAALELGFETQRVEAAKAAAEAAKGKTETVKAGETIVQIQPDGTSKVIYSAPEEAKKRETQIVNIGGKATVVDKNTGEIIHVIGTAGKGTAAGGGSSSTGTFTGKLSPVADSVLKNPALLSNFTPTERGKILSELAQSGQDLSSFTVEKLGAGQREQIALFDEIEQEGMTANLLLGDQNLGPIMSRVKSLGQAFGLAPSEFTDLRSSINNMSSVLLRMRSGAAVTPQEYERIKGFIPEINDDQKTVKRKVERFVSEIGTAKANYILRATQTSQEILKSVGQKGFQPGAAPAADTGLDDLDFTM